MSLCFGHARSFSHKRLSPVPDQLASSEADIPALLVHRMIAVRYDKNVMICDALAMKTRLHHQILVNPLV